MRLLILGATGKVGKPLVDQALQRGHRVTAFVRNRQKIDNSPPLLDAVEGDATVAKDIHKVMPGHDAVISVLGHSRSTPPEMQSNAMRNIVAAMKEQNITRIVSLTGISVFSADDKPFIHDLLMAGALMAIDQKRMQDGIKHIEVLKDSQLDWVVLRTAKHRNASKVTNYRTQPTIKGAALLVTRPNIADCLLRLAGEKSIKYRLPVLTH